MVIFVEIMEQYFSMGVDEYSPTGEYFMCEVDSLRAVKTIGEKSDWVWKIASGSSLPPKHVLRGSFFKLYRVPNSVV
jgi:hypothetical protein